MKNIVVCCGPQPREEWEAAYKRKEEEIAAVLNELLRNRGDENTEKVVSCIMFTDNEATARFANPLFVHFLTAETITNISQRQAERVQNFKKKHPKKDCSMTFVYRTNSDAKLFRPPSLSLKLREMLLQGRHYEITNIFIVNDGKSELSPDIRANVDQFVFLPQPITPRFVTLLNRCGGGEETYTEASFSEKTIIITRNT